MHPQRPRLWDQLVTEIRTGIHSGRWQTWLPQERELAEKLHASRSSLRLALEQLKDEGVIKAHRGQGNRIFPRRRPPRPANQQVSLLTPGSLEFRRPVRSLSVDHLRQQLTAAGCELNVVVSRAAYSRQPQKALTELLNRHPSDCWILRLSTQPMQAWFQKHAHPAVILGTAHSDIELPFVDVDRRALYRHAAGTLIAAGHRRIALVISEAGQGGDVASETGFREALLAGPKELRGEILHHEESVPGLIRQLQRRFRHPSPPTALIIAQPTYYLTAFSWLLQNGRQIPKDVSLLTQVHETHLSYLLPDPTCYRVDPILFSQKLLTTIRARLKNDSRAPRENWILPEYHAGGTLHPIGSA